MISPQLAELLRAYGGLGLADMTLIDEGDHCRMLHAGGFTVCVASVPDARTVMLFAEAGFLREGEASCNDNDLGDWTVLEEEDETGDDSRPNRPTVLHDERSGTLALTQTAPIEEMHSVAFNAWVSAFIEEVTQLSEIVSEVCTESEALPDASMDESAPRGATWIRA